MDVRPSSLCVASSLLTRLGLLCTVSAWPVNDRIILRAFAIASWVLAVVASKPQIWDQYHLPITLFTMNDVIIRVFW